jgi:hypothetical protein
MIAERDVIARAQRVLGFGNATTSRAWKVQRLDRPNQYYFLVELEAENTPGLVAIIDAVSGAVTHSARVSHPSLLKTPQELLGQQLNAGATMKLVWRPCDASRSPLYPLWQIRTDKDFFYLDQTGRHWRQLEHGGRGG